MMNWLSDFGRHRETGLRFHVRLLDEKWEVYGVGLEHVCACLTKEHANEVATAMEETAQRQEVSDD